MNYKKEAVKRALLGVPIGIAIGATFALVIAIIMKDSAGDSGYVSLDYYITSYIVSAIIGAVFGASSVIWDVEKLSLLKQTILYFVITIVTHMGCAVYAKWVPFQLGALLFYAGIYVVIFAIIFVIMYNVQKKKIEELNKVLES